jgi:hypothetical protein
MEPGPGRKGKAIWTRPLAALMMPLVAIPLLTACADRAERSDNCDRPVSCKEKRALPILY